MGMARDHLVGDRVRVDFVLAVAYGVGDGPVVLLVTGILLFHLVWQLTLAGSFGMLDEVWSRNLLNLIATPLTEREMLSSFGIVGLLRTAVSVTVIGAVGVVFFAVSLLWILFKLPDFAHAAAYFVGLFSSDEVPNPPKIYRSLALAYALPVILQHFIVPGRPKGSWARRLEPVFYGALVALTFAEAGPDSAFIYFQF